MELRVLICGGRDFNDASMLDRAMLLLPVLPTLIIHGGAKGADTLAKNWARINHIPAIEFLPNWNDHGKSAGPRRNIKMLQEGKPDLVIALPGGKGTAHMVSIARKAGVPTAESGRELSRLIDQQAFPTGNLARRH